MKDPIFARTRHVYPSYQDFWRLVELSSFKTCYLDEIDLDSDETYVATPFNGEWYRDASGAGTDPTTAYFKRENHPSRTAKLIWWNLERPDGNPNIFADVISQALEYADHAWSSCKFVASSDPRLQFVLIGSHPDLLDGPIAMPLVRLYDYDFTHQSYAWGRRADLYARLHRLGLKEGHACFGAERRDVLRKSRILLNAQQYPAPVYAPLRAVLAACASIPMVSETMADPYPLVQGETTWMAPIEKLPELVLELLKTPEKLEEAGRKTYELLCVEHTFRRGVETAMKELR